MISMTFPKLIGFILIIIGSILEFIEVRFESRSRQRMSIRFRKKDLTAYLSGTLFAIAGVLLMLST